MPTFRGSLRACCRQALFIARSVHNAEFIILRHPHAKYYSLCDFDEATQLFETSADDDLRICFSGSAGELISIMRHEYEQLDIFPHGEEILALSKETAPPPSSDPAEVNDDN